MTPCGLPLGSLGSPCDHFGFPLGPCWDSLGLKWRLWDPSVCFVPRSLIPLTPFGVPWAPRRLPFALLWFHLGYPRLPLDSFWPPFACLCFHFRSHAVPFGDTVSTSASYAAPKGNLAFAQQNVVLAHAGTTLKTITLHMPGLSVDTKSTHAAPTHARRQAETRQDTAKGP